MFGLLFYYEPFLNTPSGSATTKGQWECFVKLGKRCGGFRDAGTVLGVPIYEEILLFGGGHLRGPLFRKLSPALALNFPGAAQRVVLIRAIII